MHFSYSLYFISVCFVVECGKGRLMLLNVTFCGHSDVSQRGNVRQWLYETVEGLITQETADMKCWGALKLLWGMNIKSNP